MGRLLDVHLCLREGALLPGKKAQVEMAPRYRAAELLKEQAPVHAVDAAVLILLTPVNAGRTLQELLEWRVLLIRRNSYSGVHSGQIACPGGKREKQDAGLWETACREAFEEVGVNERYLERIGALTDLYVPPSNFVIHPFMALNWSEERIRPDPREVVGYKFVPVKTFNPAESVQVDFEYAQGDTRAAPAWLYEGFTIWGATAMFLSELYRLIEGGALARCPEREGAEA